MAGAATSYLEAAVLGHTLGFATWSGPAAVFVGLCTSQPNGDVGGTEVAHGAYVRQTVFFALASGQSDLAVNTATIEFPAATAPWGNVGWFEIWDARTAGNRLYWGALVDPVDGVTPVVRTIATYDIMRFSAGRLQVQTTELPSVPIEPPPADGTLTNVGGVLLVYDSAWPTSTSGLAAGALWSNDGVASVAGATTPSGTAPPVYFDLITSADLLALGGTDLPLSSGAVNQLWNNGGVVCVS